MIEALHIGLVGFFPMIQVSASLFDGLRSLGTMCIRQKTPRLPGGVQMCRGSIVKDSGASCFQLESLILAQNERWRQA